MKDILLERVDFLRPGGNDTAIVWDSINRENQPMIAAMIQKKFTSIEQVMFLEKGENTPFRGQMAGGEFCGNATRCIGYALLEGKSGNLDLEVSGTDKKVGVEVKEEIASIDIEIDSASQRIKKINESSAIIELEGIAFLLEKTSGCSKRQKIMGQSTEEQRNNVTDILKKFNLDKYPASGLLLYEDEETLHPFIWVNSTNTLYYETACGSGSIATALYEYMNSARVISTFNIKQPSGMFLTVNITDLRDDRINASISSPILRLFSGPVQL